MLKCAIHASRLNIHTMFIRFYQYIRVLQHTLTQILPLWQLEVPQPLLRPQPPTSSPGLASSQQHRGGSLRPVDNGTVNVRSNAQKLHKLSSKLSLLKMRLMLHLLGPWRVGPAVDVGPGDCHAGAIQRLEMLVTFQIDGEARTQIARVLVAAVKV